MANVFLRAHYYGLSREIFEPVVKDFVTKEINIKQGTVKRGPVWQIRFQHQEHQQSMTKRSIWANLIPPSKRWRGKPFGLEIKFLYPFKRDQTSGNLFTRCLQCWNSIPIWLNYSASCPKRSSDTSKIFYSRLKRGQCNTVQQMKKCVQKNDFE